MRSFRIVSIGLVVLCAASVPAGARHGTATPPPQVRSAPPSPYDLDRSLPGAVRTPLHATAQNETTVLGSWTFDRTSGCIAQGWTAVDLTGQPGDFFHVDDFAGLGGGFSGRLVALEGAQSMWCGARPDPNDPVVCGYAKLPGYGNDWDQGFCTAHCVPVTGDVIVDYLITWDSEAGYDATTLQWDACDDVWRDLYGGVTVYDFHGSEFGSHVLADSLHSGQVRLRFHFTSDGAWSDQDGLNDSDGAVILDSLTVSDAGGVVLPTETFENESVGDHATLSGNWTSCVTPGYGDFAALFPGVALLQEDPCSFNPSCVWAFINGSTYNYACGGHPEQTVVPYQNARSQYIQAEIWSPVVPLVGAGDYFEFNFDVYRDLPLDPLVFYIWHLRSYVDGCPQNWQDQDFVFYGAGKDWFRDRNIVGYMVTPGATDIQVGMGVIDMCQYWCGVYGTGYCHTHSPLFDNVELLRVNLKGAQWSVRDIDLFQDSFPGDGTSTGTVRADAAIDRMPSSNPLIYPGDSATVSVQGGSQPVATDPYTGTGPAVYCYVGVHPQGQPAKSGTALTDDSFRWPVVDSVSVNGDTWYCIRMDTVFTQPTRQSVVVDKYCIDLADSLFTPGDTVYFFFAAQTDTPSSVVDYYTRATGTTLDLTEAATNAMEFTCLPAHGWTLYVDGMDGRGAQPFFDTALDMMGLHGTVDRYDVRGPSSGVGNRLGARVANIFQQLIPIYQMILWDTGDLSTTLGDGTGWPDKSDDWGVLNTWLDNLTTGGGVLLCGDDLAEVWAQQTGPGAVNFRQFMHYNLVSGNARTAGFGVSPLVVGESSGCFDTFAGPDTLIAYGGCPILNDFDVLEPVGGSAQVGMSYGGQYNAGSPNAAVLTQTTTNTAGSNVTVVLAGFAFESIRDDRPAGILDRAQFLHGVFQCLDSAPFTIVGAGDTPGVSSLSQNFPNPFNPQTTIAFTVAQRGPVRLTVYNVAGQRVRTLVDDVRAPGITHRVTWDGRNNAGQRVASGVYFYRLVTKGYMNTKKMVILK